MKVVFLCGYPFVRHRFGVAEHVVKLSEFMAQQENEVHIVSYHDARFERKIKERVWMHAIRRKGYHYFLPWLAAFELYKFVRSIEPDIVHLQGATLPYVWTGLWLKTQYPTLVTIHGNPTEEAKHTPLPAQFWSRMISIPILKRAVRHMDRVIVCSDDMAKRVEVYQPQSLHIIPNGIDFEKYIDEKNFSYNPFTYILAYSRLNRIKGIDILLRSLPSVIDAAGSILVKIGGVGPEEHRLKSLVKDSGLENHVDFLGFISGERKTEMIQEAGIVVMPSRYEAFGIVLLEAMASGRPIVASRVGGIPDMLDDGRTGLLFDVDDEDGLADCLIRLISNPELRRQYGEAGHKHAKTYSWANIARRTIDVYEESLTHHVR